MKNTYRVSCLYKKPVVDFEDGSRSGKVLDVFLDRKTKRIHGISFGHGLSGTEATFYAGFEEILKIGKDFVIISGMKTATPLRKEMKGDSAAQLKGIKIATGDGGYIGEMVDFSFDRDNGIVSEIFLNDHRFIGVITDEIVIGPDVIVVPTGYSTGIRQLDVGMAGILERVRDVAPLPEPLRQRYEEIKESITKARERDQLLETLKSGSGKAQEAVRRTSRKIRKTLQQIRKSRGLDRMADAGNDFQYLGAEAEFAGKTIHESDPQPDYEARYACNSDRDLEMEERCGQV